MQKIRPRKPFYEKWKERPELMHNFLALSPEARKERLLTDSGIVEMIGRNGVMPIRGSKELPKGFRYDSKKRGKVLEHIARNLFVSRTGELEHDLKVSRAAALLIRESALETKAKFSGNWGPSKKPESKKPTETNKRESQSQNVKKLQEKKPLKDPRKIDYLEHWQIPKDHRQYGRLQALLGTEGMPEALRKEVHINMPRWALAAVSKPKTKEHKEILDLFAAQFIKASKGANIRKKEYTEIANILQQVSKDIQVKESKKADPDLKNAGRFRVTADRGGRLPKGGGRQSAVTKYKGV